MIPAHDNFRYSWPYLFSKGLSLPGWRTVEGQCAIPAIIGFMEDIIDLAMSDFTFDRRRDASSVMTVARK